MAREDLSEGVPFNLRLEEERPALQRWNQAGERLCKDLDVLENQKEGQRGFSLGKGRGPISLTRRLDFT